jgi:hypothetical protein
MVYDDWDDYLIHQAPTTLDHVQDSDPHWTDRFYFNCHARDGRALLTCGYGIFPNQQQSNGYAKLALADGRHWDVLASRSCSVDRWKTAVGPMEWQVLEPRRRWRLKLGPNPSGLEWDIEYIARAPIWELKPIFGRKQGRIIVNQQHIQQSADYSGWVHFDGETMKVDGFYGSRDRTWGIRNHPAIDMWIWYAAQFDDRAIAAWVWERKDGTVMYVDGGFCHQDGSLSRRFVQMSHELEFDRDLKRPKRGRIVFVDEDGKRHAVNAISQHPDVNVYYGAMLEPSSQSVQGQRWNEHDLAVLRRVEAGSLASDQLMRYELDGMVGYGIMELFVAGDGYDRYATNWAPWVESASASRSE